MPANMPTAIEIDLHPHLTPCRHNCVAKLSSCSDKTAITL